MVAPWLAARALVGPRAGTASRQATDDINSSRGTATERAEITLECHRRTAVGKGAGLIEGVAAATFRVRQNRFLPLGVTGNTPDSGSGESWFEPRRGNFRSARPCVTSCDAGLVLSRFE